MDRRNICWLFRKHIVFPAFSLIKYEDLLFFSVSDIFCGDIVCLFKWLIPELMPVYIYSLIIIILIKNIIMILLKWSWTKCLGTSVQPFLESITLVNVSTDLNKYCLSPLNPCYYQRSEYFNIPVLTFPCNPVLTFTLCWPCPGGELRQPEVRPFLQLDGAVCAVVLHCPVHPAAHVPLGVWPLSGGHPHGVGEVRRHHVQRRRGRG